MAELSAAPDSPPVKEHDEKPQFSEDVLKLARRVYDENRHYVEIAPTMANQVYRHGLLTKKTIGGPGHICMHGSKNYYRDSRSNTPDGALIIHRDDEDPYPGACSAFIHPPYGFVTEYRGEKGQAYSAEITLSQLVNGSVSCGFCSILYRGIVSKRKFWIVKWAKYRWDDMNPNESAALKDENESPWVEQYLKEIRNDKAIDESLVLLNIQFPKGHSYVKVHMMVGPEPNSKSGRRRPLIDLEFYTETGYPNPWAAFGPASHIHPEVFSESSISQLTTWIHECSREHSLCNSTSVRALPSRLLRLHWTQPIELLPEAAKKKWLKRLIEKIKNINKTGRTRTLRRHKIASTGAKDPLEDLPLIQLHCTRASSSYTYVALSHVWNMTQPLKTTMANISNHMKSVPWASLSFALRDAIFMTLSLGIEYLWVDSLCIIQDSPRDWQLEAPRMGQIYGNAQVVFAAHGPELGLEKAPLKSLNEEDPERAEDNPVFVREKLDHSALFSTPQGPESWFGRGWCLQERVFAPRILHFGGYCEELFFECNMHVKCECGRIEEDSRGSSGSSEDFQKKATWKAQLAASLRSCSKNEEASDISISVKDGLWRTYISAVEDYTARSLTFATDTFPAVSSLMKAFSPHLGSYYAGLWDHNLILSLQWEALDTGKSIRHTSDKVKYVAPSWSWASRSGAVVWYMDVDTVPNDETHEFAMVVQVYCGLADKDPFGTVTGGYITLRGRTTRMRIDSTTMLVPDGRLQMSPLDMQSPDKELESNKGKRMGSTRSKHAGSISSESKTDNPSVNSERQTNHEKVEGKDKRKERCFVTLDAVQDVQAVQQGTEVLCLDVMRDRAGTHGQFVSGLVLLPVMGSGNTNELEITKNGAMPESSRRRPYRRIGFSTMSAADFADQDEEEEVTII